MTKGTKHVDGHYYPSPHPGWGGFCDELFHYTSRYYAVTESFLRHLADRPDFSMSGYKANRLSESQRELMSRILTTRPEKQSALQVISIVDAVHAGSGEVEEALWKQFDHDIEISHDTDMIGHVPKPHPLDISPLEPWLNMAERLNMAVAVHDHVVELDMKILAQHLDSTNATLRTNLQKGIVDLHEAGYLVKNHPHMTHQEAHEIGEDGAV